MALDARYVTTVSLEEYFVDKDSGTPNSFGTIEFWQDDNRIVPKNVFELTGAPPNYTYSPLPNPITLSAVGTPSDANGNNVAIYYFPYDAAGNVQLYYVVVRDQFGTIQETREAWPNITASSNPAAQESGLFNQLVNPQFAFVNFLPNNPLTITNSAGAGTYSYSNIIPGWTITVTYTGNGSIQVKQTAIAGTSQYPGNPPYTISITPGANVSALTVTQFFTNNPNIFAPANGGVNGYLAGSILLAPGSSIMMYYQPNGQPSQQILAVNNTSGVFEEFDNTIQLSPANNANTATTGFVSIFLVLPIVGTTTFSNVQVVGVNSNVQGITFNQETVAQQLNQLFNVYYGQLYFKPIPDHLVGWNFPYNPAQFLGQTVAAFASGDNTSNYVWDQTILFQSANSGAAVSSSASGSGAIRITATNTTQFALIQYLPQEVAREMLLQKNLSCSVTALTNQVAGISGKVTMWCTTGANLPSTGANQSIVATLDLTGRPATFNQASGTPWTEITRNNLGDGTFSLSNTGATNLNSSQLIGYGLNGAAIVNTATWYAIVIGFAPLTAGNYVEINNITVVPGLIASAAAPKTPNQINDDCFYYYQKSFPPGVVPAAATGPLGMANTSIWRAGANGFNMPGVVLPVQMYNTPVITTYNPHTAASAQVYDYTTPGDFTGTSTGTVSVNGFSITASALGGSQVGDFIGVHWTADARLGL